MRITAIFHAFLLVFLTLVSTSAWSQAQPDKPGALPPFGSHAIDWFKGNPYASDSSVHAYVIAKHVSTHLSDASDVRWQLFSDHRRIVRILNRDGTDHATVRLSFYSPKGERAGENIRDLKAMTLTKTGSGIEKTEVKAEDVFRSRINANYEEVTFSFAGVQDGSVLDLSYSLRSDYIRRLDRFYFQESIPVQSALLEFSNPAHFNYSASFTGFVPLYKEVDRKRSRSDMNNVEYTSYLALWAIDVPLIRTEPYVSTIDNYRSNASVELNQYSAPGGAVEKYTTTWEEVADKLRNNLGYKEAMQESKFYQEWAGNYTGADDLMEKYDWAFAQVTSKVSPNRFVSTVSNVKPKKTIEEGEGNSAEVNILLVGLCRALGLQAAPVLLSERSYGSIVEELPGTQNLRHMICAVEKGNRYVYADATKLYSAPSVLPNSDLNGNGFLVANDEAKFIDLHVAAIGMTQLIATLEVSPEHEVSGEVTFMLAGNSALEYLKVVNGERVFDRENFKPLSGYDVEVKQVENTGRMRFRVTAEVKRKSKLPSVEGVAAFSPCIDGAWLKNPFADENRKYPVEFPYGIIQSREVTVTLPENMTFESVPEPLVVKTSDGKCKYQYSTTPVENGLSISQSLHVRQLVHTPNQYAGLRDMFEMLSKKEQEYLSLTSK